MKKVIISIGLITNILQVSTAQMQKGSWMLDGGLHYNQKNIDAEDSNWGRTGQYKQNVSDVLVSGSVGYFGSNQFVFGGSAAFGLLNITSSYTSTISVRHNDWRFQTHQVAPFVRYYFNPQSKFKTFYELSTGLNWHRRQRQYGNQVSVGDKVIENYFYWNIKNTFGIQSFLTENLALEGTINYNYFSYITNMELLNREPFGSEFPQSAWLPKLGIKLFLNTKPSKTPVLAAHALRKKNRTIGLLATADGGHLNHKTIEVSLGHFWTNRWLIMGTFYYNNHPKYYAYRGFAPELRYYQPVSPTTQIFIRGAATISAAGLNFNNHQYWRGKNSLETGLGLNHFISDKVSIQGTVNWNKATYEGYPENTYNLKVGFQYFIIR